MMVLRVFPHLFALSWTVIGKKRSSTVLWRFFFLSFLKKASQLRAFKKQIKIIRGIKGPKKSFFLLKSFVLTFSLFWKTSLGFSKSLFNIFFYLVTSSFFNLSRRYACNSEIFKF